MKIAYLVLTHRNPRLLERVVQSLSCDDGAFFIHVDKKSNITPFLNIRSSNIHFVEERIPVYWGEYSIVRGITSLIQQALRSPQHYDYLLLLSGSEYPLHSRTYIHQYLEENRGSEFMTLEKVPAPGKPLSRFTTLRFESHKPVRRFASRALAKLGLSQRDYRKCMGEMEPYSGRCWWALSNQACQFLIDFLAQNPEVVRFFENTFVPDENFLQTILGNSEFTSKIRSNLHYEDWSIAGPHPAMITERHIEHFRTHDKVFDGGQFSCPTESLFARKFCDENLHLLNAMDKMIAEKESRYETAALPTQ